MSDYVENELVPYFGEDSDQMPKVLNRFSQQYENERRVKVRDTYMQTERSKGNKEINDDEYRKNQSAKKLLELQNSDVKPLLY